MRHPKTTHRPLHLPRRHIGVNAARLPRLALFTGRILLLPNSSLELFQRTSPLPTSPLASTPRTCRADAVQIPSLDRFHLFETFRSRRFSPPQRFAPQKALQVYCTLLPVMGSARFQSSLSDFSRRFKPVQVIDQRQPKPTRFHHFSVILTHDPKTVANSHNKPKSQTDALSLERIHPSKPSPLTQPYHRHHLRCVFPPLCMPPNGLPLSLLLGTSVHRVHPDSLQNPTSHSLWVTQFNLRDLSQARVRCTHTPFPMCPCSLLPWAFRMSVHRHSGNVRSNPIARTETRPDAPTSSIDRNPKEFCQTPMFPRPPRLIFPSQSKLFQTSIPWLWVYGVP